MPVFEKQKINKFWNSNIKRYDETELTLTIILSFINSNKKYFGTNLRIKQIIFSLVK